MEKIKKIFTKINSWKFLKKIDKYLTIIFIIGIFAVVNFIATQIFFRADLTAGGDFSISRVSKKTVEHLDDIVNIKAYFTKNLPVKYLTTEQEVEDILNEYANYSNGKIKVKVIDPTTLADSQNAMAAIGIPTLQFNVVQNDSFQVVQGYLGISIEYGGQRQTIPVVGDTQNLEYQITSAIKKLTGKEMPTIGLVTSNGTISASEPTSASENTIAEAKAKLSELYKLKNIDLAKDKITDDISTLLLVGPKEKFTEDELKKIDAFVMKGKSLIILADGVNVAKGSNAVKNDLGWDKLLSGYGLKLNNDLVSDTSNGRASFSSNNGAYTMNYMINYPLWPKILPNNLDDKNVITANLQNLILPWASSIEITLKDGENISVLAKSTNSAWLQTDNFNINPRAVIPSVKAGQYDLAVYVSGKLTSPYGQGSTDEARIILVGDSDFATDNFAGSGSDNMLFFQNIADGLTLDSDLINIRAKSATERPIKPLENSTKNIIRYGNIFGVTVIVLFVGLLRYFLRRRNKKQAIGSM
jgi:gliding-associated putative ABC transporter substrate-binding component GldG